MYHILVSLFVVYHLVMIADSIGRHTTAGAAIRPWIVPYERTLGVYQNWRMFAPNPPRSYQWMEMTLTDAAGNTQPLPLLMGARPPRQLELRYQRAGKLERNLLSQSRRKSLDRALRHLCTQHTDAKTITVTSAVQKTPSPAARRRGELLPIKRTVVKERRCRR
ncbi:MAG: hypothetical protein AAFV53_03190 [Myxococcota bacterium]